MTPDPALRHILEGLEAVLRCFGVAREHITVVGGLAPSLLVPRPTGSAHVGSADVDFLYPGEAATDAMRKQRSGEEWESAALRSLGEDFAALAVGFRHLLECTRERVEFAVTLDGALVPRAWVHVAGPAALAALKASALTSRRKHKDAYDVVWLLAERGPEASAWHAARRVEGEPAAAAELREAVELLEEVFAEGREGPVWYATFMQPADDFDRERHERFALETVAAFTTTLREARA